MAQGRRCDTGCESWPDDDSYKRCPMCGDRTSRYSNLRPLDADEARSLKLTLEFESMYAAYCKANGQTVDGPLPMPPEESLKWDAKYPNGKPDAPAGKGGTQKRD